MSVLLIATTADGVRQDSQMRRTCRRSRRRSPSVRDTCQAQNIRSDMVINIGRSMKIKLTLSKLSRMMPLLLLISLPLVIANSAKSNLPELPSTFFRHNKEAILSSGNATMYEGDLAEEMPSQSLPLLRSCMKKNSL